jgi:hypothetical protein
MVLLTVLTKDTNLFSCSTLICTVFYEVDNCDKSIQFFAYTQLLQLQDPNHPFWLRTFSKCYFCLSAIDSCLVGNANIHFNQSNNLNYFDLMLIIQLFSSFWIIPFIMWRRQWMMISLWHSQSVRIKPRKWEWLTRRWNMRMWWTI